MKQKKALKQRVRTLALFNTGTRVHRPLKGKGAYRRKAKYSQSP